jgi:hypothetical protein
MNRNQNANLRKKTAILPYHMGIDMPVDGTVSWWCFGAFYSQNGVSAKPRQWYFSRLES